MATEIKPCNCNHEYQDEKYGRGRRVMNSLPNGSFRCTACGKTLGGSTGGKKK